VLLLGLEEIKHAIEVEAKKLKVIISFCLGLVLVKGRWSCFLVLDGMRLCECFDF
jgi:hypothetical protein